MKNNRAEIIDYVNSLGGYEGYVQFSHRPIDKEKDIFYDGKKVEISNEAGFVYEAHFCNGTESIAIRQINNSWPVSVTDISGIEESDTQEYLTDIKAFDRKVKMVQIWEEVEDEFCEGMKVNKLQKVVFGGFANG